MLSMQLMKTAKKQRDARSWLPNLLQIQNPLDPLLSKLSHEYLDNDNLTLMISKYFQVWRCKLTRILALGRSSHISNNLTSFPRIFFSAQGTVLLDWNWANISDIGWLSRSWIPTALAHWATKSFVLNCGAFPMSLLFTLQLVILRLSLRWWLEIPLKALMPQQNFWNWRHGKILPFFFD